MKKNKRTLEEQLYYIGLAFLILGGISVFIYLKIVVPNANLPQCVWWTVLGIYCPGCGGTRAFEALLQGHILQSLWYHPLVLYAAVLFGGFMLTHTMERLHIWRIKGWKFHNWYLYGALAIVVINFLVKNIALFCFDIRM